MPPKSSGAESARSAGGRTMHNVGADCQVPLPMFSARNEAWAACSARFEACAELAGWSSVLEVAARQTAPTSMAGAKREALCCVTDED